MGPKKGTVNALGASSSHPPHVLTRADYDTSRFVSTEAQERFVVLSGKPILEERGMEFSAEPLVNQPLYEPIRAEIARRQWDQFVDCNGKANHTLTYEFLANWPEKENNAVMVRGKKIPVTLAAFNQLYEVPNFPIEEEELRVLGADNIDYVDLAETLGFPGARIHLKDGEPNCMYRCELNQVARAWCYFVSARLIPNNHLSDIPVDRLKVTYAILKGYNINIGRYVRESINHIIQGTTTGGLGHGTFITELCVAYGAPQYLTDMKVPPQKPVGLAMVNRLIPPHPYGAPQVQRGRGRRRQRTDDVEDEPELLGGPMDPAMQYTHAQLNYLIQQNMHMQTYMGQRSAYDANHIQQLNSLVSRWSLDEEDENYFALPPRFTPYDQPPPPNPF